MTDATGQELHDLGVEQFGKDENRVFEDDEIQAVFICSPSDTHANFSLRAIDRNKHVFCEKPVDFCLSRIRDVQNALRGSSLVYQVGFNRRFDHNFMAVRQGIENNAIGKVQMIRITSRDPSPPPLDYIKASGGLFFDMMIHDFDMIRFQSASEVTEVYAAAAVLVDENIGKAGDVDSAVVTCKLKGGALGYIENCRKAVYGYDQRLEVLGTQGALSIANDTPSQLTTSTHTGISTEKPLLFFLERYEKAYSNEQKAFIDAIQRNEPSPCGIDAGYESVRLAYAAQKSFTENKPVLLQDIS